MIAYDYYDFGISNGGSYNFGKMFGGKFGLGFDKLRHRVNKLRAKGIPCTHADIVKHEFDDEKVKFILMCHFLEHLDSEEDVKHVIEKSLKLATDFVYIEGPSFDFDSYLKGLGFKFFWLDGCGHKTRVTINLLKTIFAELGLKDFTFQTERPYVVDSTSRDIFPYNYPTTHTYFDSEIHGSKCIAKFSGGVFRSFNVFVWLNKNIDKNRRQTLLNKRKIFSIYR